MEQATAETQGAFEGTRALNPQCRRRKSPNSINLVFIPGQNVVLELNEVAGAILDVFANKSASYEELKEELLAQFEVDDYDAFSKDLELLLARFLRHEVLVEEPRAL